jgi:hypothetical protein
LSDVLLSGIILNDILLSVTMPMLCRLKTRGTTVPRSFYLRSSSAS